MSGKTAVTPGASRAGRHRSADAIVFDVVLILFAATIVYSAWNLGSGAALVPLVIGIPTLIGLLGQLAIDLYGRSDRMAPRVDSTYIRSPDDALRLAHAEMEAEHASAAPGTRSREALFAGWVFLYVACGWFTNFLVALPPVLFGIVWLTSRNLVIALLVTVFASAVAVLVFDVFLNVPF